MAFCLTKQAKDDFKRALREREIDPIKLSAMESVARRTFLEKYVGRENAVQVNALFESKLLLKNQKAGYISWAKKVAGITPEVKRDLLSRIERMDTVLSPTEEQSFLQDLADTRLGFGVTEEEAKNISELSRRVVELRGKANLDGVFPTETDRLAYGSAQVAIEQYVNDLKLEAKRISFKEHPIKKTKQAALEIPGSIKSIVASWDNSFFGRQGIKTLYTSPTVWGKAFLKSWVDIARQLKAKGKWYGAGDDAVINALKADIYSRPNALNGKYEAGNYGLNVLSEEAFPSSLPEKIPLFGRVFKASEVAYNGAALRMRADLADKLIKVAEKQGINTLNKEEARGMGQLVSSITGRGSIGKLEPVGKELNVLMFSIKFLKSNFDTLTAHQLDPKATPFTKKVAAQNWLKIVGTIAAILTIAKIHDKNSVDEDPRSTNFGKVKVFGRWTDITGGMHSLVTLAARLIPTMHDGQWGFWSKSRTGKFTNLAAGQYGQQTALDVFENFWEGKLSPFAGVVRDVWTGKDFQGQPITLEGEMKNLLQPISLQNFQQLKEDPTAKSGDILGAMILDGLGFSVNTTTYKKDWTTSTSKELTGFRAKVGDVKFKQANAKFNKQFGEWQIKVTTNLAFQRLSDTDKQKVIDAGKAKIQKDIEKQYGYSYKIKRSKSGSKNIKSLLP